MKYNTGEIKGSKDRKSLMIIIKRSKNDERGITLSARHVREGKENSKQALIEAIELSLQTACKNHFGSADNVHVSMNPDTAVFSVFGR